MQIALQPVEADALAARFESPCAVLALHCSRAEANPTLKLFRRQQASISRDARQKIVNADATSRQSCCTWGHHRGYFRQSDPEIR